MADTALTVISPDLSENCLGRALLLAELLAGELTVRIAGIRRRPELWPPARAAAVPIDARELRHAGHYPGAAAWLRRRVAGTRVLVSKPRPTSLGLALAAGLRPRQLLLDIDDWEVGFRKTERAGVRLRIVRGFRDAQDLLDPTSINSYWAELALDRVAGRFPHRIVSNAWLAQRFGGAILPHVRDTDWLDPEKVDAGAARRELGMDGRVWAGFIGTARQHKGVDDLVEALAAIEGDAAPGLFLAGIDRGDPYVQGLLTHARDRLGSERLRVVGHFDFRELPRWVSIPDILCIPSRDEPGTRGQIPAKLFDAMSMAKPVVASRVNDMERILEGCGVVVDPGDVGAMGRAISELSRNAERRRELGIRARHEAVARYSYAAARQTLRTALTRVEPVPR